MVTVTQHWIQMKLMFFFKASKEYCIDVEQAEIARTSFLTTTARKVV